MTNIDYNKIAAAVLIALLVGLLSSIVAEELTTPKHLEKNVYVVEGVEKSETPAGGAAGATPEVLEPITPLLASADTAKGQELFKKCAMCHSTEKGGPNKVGPNQWGVVGGHFGHKDDFSYSDAIKSKSTEKWDYENLNAFLANPKKFLPGTKMAFIGVPKAQDRANLIAYLRTQSDNPLPLP